MEGLKDLLVRKTVNWFSYVVNVFWILLGIILSAILLEIENSEPSSDVRCGSNGDNEEVIGVKCYEQYEKQYNKFGIPVYGFVIFNFFVTAVVCGIYSQAVKSTVDDLEGDADRDVEGRTSRRKLFKAYCLQLLARFVLGIIFVLLQAKLLYPRNFPSKFNCNLTKDEKFSDNTASTSPNVTQTQTSYQCFNQGAAKKTFWAYAVIFVTGAFVILVFIEVLYMLLRARKVERFMEDTQFYNYYLKSNSYVYQPEPKQTSEEEESFNCPQTNEQTSVSTFVERMKEHVLRKTKQSDRDPFNPNPGEGTQRDQTLDQIYTNLVIHEGRVDYDFTGDREKRLEEYPKHREHSRPTLPGDIFGAAEQQKILVVGRPGIGKTLFSTKILRDWASDNLFKEAQKSLVDFKVAFLIKLRRFNSKKDEGKAAQDEELSLRDLLNHSEYSAKDLTEEVWNYILKNPNEVLVIFDGFDEYSGKTKIDDESDFYGDNEQESMPIHVLFKKIASGDILSGATVLTTTRPNAVSCMRSLKFNKTVEILGFTSEQVDEYVQNFTKGDDQKANTIKQHINSNLNLLSFCYIPVNCFIICSCLFHLLSNSNSADLGFLPTTLTEIYSIAVKYFYYRHHSRENKVENYFRKPFKDLSSSVQDVFTRLGEIAFKGIQNGRLIFESDEVNDLENNGLFHRLPDTRDRPLAEGRPQYCFLHLTIQEFLAANYLVKTLSHEELRKFVSDHIEKGAWKVVIQFVAGLLAEQEEPSTDIFSDLLPSKTFTIRANGRIGWPAREERALVVTLFNCMYENNASDQEVQKKLAKMGCSALDFSDCSLSPLDCLALVHALKSVEGILDFDLGHNNLQSLGCIELAKLFCVSEHNQLSSFTVHFNPITDQGVNHLVTALTHSNCKLTNLRLIDNKITDEGVKHLTVALTHTNCKLNSLSLEKNQITDKGAKQLTLALTHSNCKLIYLSLGSNEITNEGARLLTLAITHSNCKLKYLYLRGNWGITHEHKVRNKTCKVCT